LKEVVAVKLEKLEALVVDGGDHWNVEQRQLLCLGRIMLKCSKILLISMKQKHQLIHKLML